MVRLSQGDISLYGGMNRHVRDVSPVSGVLREVTASFCEKKKVTGNLREVGFSLPHQFVFAKNSNFYSDKYTELHINFS